MPAFYFSIGFFTSAFIIVGIIAGVYYLTKKQKNAPKIQGYLDLIPDLSATQRRQVQEIRQTFLPRVADIRKGLYLKRSELADLLFEEPLDRARIGALTGDILKYQSTLENEVIEHIIEEKDLLTPRQKRKFYNIIEEQFSAGGLGVHDVTARKP